MACDVVWLAAVEPCASGNNVCNKIITDVVVDTLSNARVVMHSEDGTVVNPSERESSLVVDDDWVLLSTLDQSSSSEHCNGGNATPKLGGSTPGVVAGKELVFFGSSKLPPPPGLTSIKVGCQMSQTSMSYDDKDAAVLKRWAVNATEPCDMNKVCVDVQNVNLDNLWGNTCDLFYCEVCDIWVKSSAVREHQMGLRHANKLQSYERVARWRLRTRPRGPDLRSD